jgi:2-oxoglutarate dehydrogenase E1 component
MSDADSASRGLPVSGSFNDAYVADLYDAFRRDPASVDTSWREFFGLAERLTGTAGAAGASVPIVPTSAPNVAAALLKKAAGAGAFMQAIRQYGHFAVQLDPLGALPLGAEELTPEFHGITEADLDLIPGSVVGFPHMATVADVARRLRLRYTTALGIEVTHLAAEAERKWFRQILTAEELTRPLTPDEKRAVLLRLTEVDGLERFIGRAFPTAKRFSIEGTDALVPMLDTVLTEGAAAGAERVVIAMAHRGRLNVLAHILGKSYAAILAEFTGKPAGEEGGRDADSGTGDVKYHLGFTGRRILEGGGARTLEVRLVPNPSHLEFVNPVLAGLARAFERDGVALMPERVVPVCVHGDAAFPGEGVVSETFNLSRLRGYAVGGTLHLIVNNQIGFTTDPMDGRSTHYASDIAKGFDVPIIHVNADNPAACVTAVRIAVAYRAQFGKDFLIDLVGYRRYGHNEGDEPSFTQPMQAAAIKAHPSVRALWGAQLVAEGVVGAADVDAAERTVGDRLAAIHEELSTRSNTAQPQTHDPLRAPLLRPLHPIATQVPVDRLTALNERLLHWPADFTVHPRLARQLMRRRDALHTPDGTRGAIDWGHAEALAWGSLLADGIPVRLTGQDAERGTFSQRHAVLHDVQSGATYVPLQHVDGGGHFEVYNSPLSETAVLGFEYGYSSGAPDALVLWEAQYGDFVNVAQPIIDQFIASDHAKWGQDTGVVLLLPHGYEGQGPEHSSARLERFLALSAEGNMVVVYPTTAAQYFHILRRQALSRPRRPLVLLTPKSLLRLDRAASSVPDLASGHFLSVIDDPIASAGPERAEEVRRLVLCSGKVYYDLSASERPAHVALVRIEELYPWPREGIAWILDHYPGVTDVVWAQEEPMNMGAWTFAAPRLGAQLPAGLGVRYIGRPERASPAEGYQASHQEQQARIVADVLGPLPLGRGGDCPPAARGSTVAAPALGTPA